MIALRPMRNEDLILIEAWLAEPHVSRWWLTSTTVAQELTGYEACLSGADPTHLLMISSDGQPIGWCQWYLCADNPVHAAGIGAQPDDVGIDYAIGDSAALGRGLGTQMIAELVRVIREEYPDVAIMVDPAAANLRSRRVLEKNGFQLCAVRPVESEPDEELMAIYRLAPTNSGSAARSIPRQEGNTNGASVVNR